MQILPTIQNQNNLESWIGSGTLDVEGMFMQAMQDAMESVEDGSDFSVSSSVANDSRQPQSVVDSPYSRNSTDGVTYTLEEISFTKSELEQLHGDLVKGGAPAESLTELSTLAGQPDGATLGQVMAALHGTERVPDLDDEDINTVTSLCNQIDPSGTLAKDTLAAVHAGKGAQALSLILNAIGKMESGTVQLSQDDAIILGKALGLNKSSIASLVASFGGNDQLVLSPAQMAGFLQPARAQFMNAQLNRDKLETALDKTLKPIIRKARDRMEKEKAASERQSRRVEQSRILIDKTVQEHTRGVLEETLNAGREEDSFRNAMRDRKNELVAETDTEKAARTAADSNLVKLARTEKADLATSNADNLRDLHSANNARNVRQNQEQQEHFTGNGGTSSQQENTGQRNNGDRAGRDELAGKIELSSKPIANNSPNSPIFSMVSSGQNLPGDMEIANIRLTGNQPLSRHLAGQVEQGMLTALRSGATRLDLELHPGELGALTLILTSKDGEVSAQIRTDRKETAEIIARQMETIRINLEQQGIKIDKLEVQLQENKDDARNNPWQQDMAQHNARQEQEARRDEMARLRNLAGARRSGRSGMSSSLDAIASPDLNPRYANQSLHIVA